MKSAMVVTWCCVTALLFGVVTVLQERQQRGTHAEIILCTDENQVYSLVEHRCYDREDVDDIDPAHIAKDGLVWITHQEIEP
jgi:hypothetical protein